MDGYAVKRLPGRASVDAKMNRNARRDRVMKRSCGFDPRARYRRKKRQKLKIHSFAGRSAKP
jgi:hypothetical protein